MKAAWRARGCGCGCGGWVVLQNNQESTLGNSPEKLACQQPSPPPSKQTLPSPHPSQPYPQGAAGGAASPAHNPPAPAPSQPPPCARHPPPPAQSRTRSHQAPRNRLRNRRCNRRCNPPPGGCHRRCTGAPPSGGRSCRPCGALSRRWRAGAPAWCSAPVGVGVGVEVGGWGWGWGGLDEGMKHEWGEAESECR